jgi:hypothetical protein
MRSEIENETSSIATRRNACHCSHGVQICHRLALADISGGTRGHRSPIHHNSILLIFRHDVDFMSLIHAAIHFTTFSFGQPNNGDELGDLAGWRPGLASQHRCATPVPQSHRMVIAAIKSLVSLSTTGQNVGQTIACIASPLNYAQTGRKIREKNTPTPE